MSKRYSQLVASRAKVTNTNANLQWRFSTICACRLRPLEALASPQRGMAESMDYMPAYRMPARWPSMVAALAASPDQPLRVQVCHHSLGGPHPSKFFRVLHLLGFEVLRFALHPYQFDRQR